MAIAVLLGLALMILQQFVRGVWSAAAAVIAVLLVLAGSWTAYSGARLLLDPVYPMVAVLLIYLTVSLVIYLRAERERQFVRDAFSSYVSPNLVQHFIDHPSDLEIGGERRECTFVLTDLAGFTSLCEKSDPAELVSVLNGYLDEMTRIAFAHQGTLDRIIGDAVAIMFSAPVVQPDHAELAVGCALAMDRFSQEYSRTMRAEGVPLGHTRIGVNSGPVIIGNVGGDQHSDYRALGDPINTASRLENLNKHLGTRICVSGTTVVQCPRFIGRPVGNVVLMGKTQPIQGFEPLTPEDHESAATAAYMEAFHLLDTDGAAAREAFTAAVARFPDDPLAAFHLKRLEAGEVGSTIVMTEK